MLNEQVIADNHALIERNRELECELAALKARIGRVDRIADACHARAVAELEAWGEMPVPRSGAAVVRAFAEMASELREAIK